MIEGLDFNVVIIFVKWLGVLFWDSGGNVIILFLDWFVFIYYEVILWGCSFIWNFGFEIRVLVCFGFV